MDTIVINDIGDHITMSEQLLVIANNHEIQEMFSVPGIQVIRAELNNDIDNLSTEIKIIISSVAGVREFIRPLTTPMGFMAKIQIENLSNQLNLTGDIQ